MLINMFDSSTIRSLLDITRNDWLLSDDKRARYAKQDFKSVASSDKVVMAIPIPGFGVDDLKVHVENSVLIIEGESEHEILGESVINQKYTVPRDIDIEKIESSMKDGVLTITLPRKEVSKKYLTIKTDN